MTFVFSLPLIIVVIYVVPLWYMATEMIIDYKTKRLKVLENFGLSRIADRISWLFFTLAISVYYGVIIFACGLFSNSFITVGDLFCLIFYGLTNFGASYFIT